MTEKFMFKIYQQAELDRYISGRDGEIKAGQAIKLLADDDTSLPEKLNKAYGNGAAYAIVLIPENIGPKANGGNGSADQGPEAFLNFFLNMQANQFVDYAKVVLAGEVIVNDLIDKSNVHAHSSQNALRELCAEIDARVAPVVKEIVKAGLEPIVIGGGNNNSLPTIQGVVEAWREKGISKDSGIAVVNCDPHADFRRLEGRHSGNPFSYAHDRGYLKQYCVLGLHENYNNADMISRLEQNNFPVFKYEDFAIRKTITFAEALHKVCAYLSVSDFPVGCELDVDGICDMPASARTPFGISPQQAAQYIHAIASKLNTAYFHLSEGAPDVNDKESMRTVGKVLALAVVTYIKARQEYWAKHRG